MAISTSSPGVVEIAVKSSAIVRRSFTNSNMFISLFFQVGAATEISATRGFITGGCACALDVDVVFISLGNDEPVRSIGKFGS
jgi:hypothetical protein